MFFFFSSRRRHTRCALVTGVQTCALPIYPGLVEGTPLSPGWLPSNNPYRIAPGTSAGDRDAIARYVRASVQAHHILLRALVEAGVPEIGRASCRGRVCQYVWISVVSVSLKKQH